MPKVVIPKTFLKAVEEALIKKGTPNKLPLITKDISASAFPDIGEEDTKNPSLVEKAMRLGENVEGKMSDTAFGSAALVAGKDILGLTSKASNALANTSNTLGNSAGYLQAALWGADALKTVADKDYRDKELENQAARLENGDMAGAIGAAIQRPTSGLYGAFAAAADASIREKQRQGDLDYELYKARLAERRQKPKDVPEITPDTIRKGQALKYFTQYNK